jgi:hypothetical protein
LASSSDGWLLARALEGDEKSNFRTQIPEFPETVSAWFGASSAAHALADLIDRCGLEGRKRSAHAAGCRLNRRYLRVEQRREAAAA